MTIEMNFPKYIKTHGKHFNRIGKGVSFCFTVRIVTMGRPLSDKQKDPKVLRKQNTFGSHQELANHFPFISNSNSKKKKKTKYFLSGKFSLGNPQFKAHTKHDSFTYKRMERKKI